MISRVSERLSAERIAAITSRFSSANVLVVGDAMLDEFVWGGVSRISPEAPVPVVEVRGRSVAPGGAANAGANAASLGAQVALGAVIGGDAEGERLRKVIAERRVDDSGLVVDAERHTTCKTRIIAHEQQVVRIDAECCAPLSEKSESLLLAWAELRLTSASAFILSDYGKGVVSPKLSQRLILKARSLGVPIIVDPKGADFRQYRGATVVKPNIHEAGHACNRCIDGEESLAAAGRELTELLPGTSVVITRGADGITLFRPEKGPLSIYAIARRVFDVTGAGDTVAGMLAVAMGSGASLEEAAELANIAAGIAVTKIGTNVVEVDELLNDCACS